MDIFSTYATVKTHFFKMFFKRSLFIKYIKNSNIVKYYNLK